MSAHSQYYTPPPQRKSVRVVRRSLLIPLVAVALLWALTLSEPNAPTCAVSARSGT
jgi:hypothetical protein